MEDFLGICSKCGGKVRMSDNKLKCENCQRQKPLPTINMEESTSGKQLLLD